MENEFIRIMYGEHEIFIVKSKYFELDKYDKKEALRFLKKWIKEQK